jgi:hypothetical protein
LKLVALSPEAVVEEFCPLLRAYRVSSVQGDKFAGEGPREQFKKRGVTYDPAAKPKSDLYRDLLPAINSRKVELLDHPHLVQQIVGLERKTAWGGRTASTTPPARMTTLLTRARASQRCPLRARDTTSMRWRAEEVHYGCFEALVHRLHDQRVAGRPVICPCG